MCNVPKVKQFPKEGFDNSKLDLLNIQKVYFHGLYERTVTLSDGTVRSYKAYIPSTAAYGDDSTYVAVPDGVDTAEFLAKSGWLDEVEKKENAVILFAFEPANKSWGDPAVETEYIAKAWADMNDKSGKGFRDLVFISDFNWRWMGYGKGGEMVMRQAMKDHMLLSSLVVVGDTAIEAETLKAAAETCYVSGRGTAYPEWPNKKIPLPIWLMGCKDEATIDYWKTANGCKGNPVMLADGVLYQQNPNSGNIMTYDQKVGQVKVSPNVENYCDPKLTEKICAFMQSFSRCGMGSPYANMLYATTPDCHFQRDTMIIDDMEREWYVNIPENYDPEKPMPLVIYFHGSGQTGLIAMRQGGWWQYGEKKGFITVCPSGSLRKRGEGLLPFVIWRSSAPRSTVNPDFRTIMPNRSFIGVEECQIENRFVHAMVEKLCSQYNIDRSRMYITGQSNGGGMTAMMAELGADLFAAAASTGAATSVPHSPMSVFTLGGQFDLHPIYLTAENDVDNDTEKERITEAMAEKGIAYDDHGFYRNGIFNILEWKDAAGTPVYRFCTVSGQAHSWRQDTSHLFWDDWFSKFSRDLATGKTLYMGK